MKKKRILKALRKAMEAGCSCVADPKAICGSCLAADILGEPAGGPRPGHWERVRDWVSDTNKTLRQALERVTLERDRLRNERTNAESSRAG